MGAKENLDLVGQLQQAARDGDFDRYGELVADDAVWRMAGVPAGMGGVTTGREAIVDLVSRNTGGGGFEIKQQFGDDEHVCVVGKVTADRFIGSQYLRSADRRWFCEGVANFVTYRVLAGIVGADVARSYYDVDAELAKHAALRTRIDLPRWLVVEDASSRVVPPEVNAASYAFATKAIFSAFAHGEQRLLANVLTEVAKTPKDRATIDTVYAAYRALTGRDLREHLK